MNEQKRDIYEIDLLRMLRALLNKARLIIVVTVLLGIVAFSYSFFLVKPLYTSTALMYVNNSSVSIGSTSVSFSSSELSAAQKLVDTYLVILNSRTTLEDVIKQSNVQYDYNELKKMISAGSVNNTEIFKIEVTSQDAAEAKLLANTIANILPKTISDVVDGSDVRIVDYAVQNDQRVSPSYTKYTAIGLLLGFFISCIWVILADMMDDMIRDEDYLVQSYDVPILASIPDLALKRSGEYQYKSYGNDGRKGT